MKTGSRFGAVLFAFCLFFAAACLWAQEEEPLVSLASASAAARFGVRNSRNLQLQRLEKLEGIKLAAYSFRDFLPSLSFSYNENDSRVKNAPDSRSRHIQVSLTQPLFDGGKKRLQYELGKIGARYAYEDFLLSVRGFESGIIDSYCKVLLLAKTELIQADVLDAARKQLAVLRRQFELGEALETDYLEYEIACLQIEREKIRTANEREKAGRDLKVLLGLPEQAQLALPGATESETACDFELLVPRADNLWLLAKTLNPELAKKQVEAEFQRKLLRFDQLRNVPNLSVQASMGFSGQRFPLTEPSFSLKFILEFNNRLFPSSLSGGLAADLYGVNGVNSGGETQVLASSTAFAERRLSKLSLLAAQIGVDESGRQFKAALYDMLFQHDDFLHELDAKERTISLMEKRLAVNKAALNNGEYKQIDYLNDLTACAKVRIELASVRLQLEAIERSLEIMISLPFGGINEAIHTEPR